MTKQKITEKSGIHKEWYTEAGIQKTETLFLFIDHLLNDYEHDYGTIVHAIAACGLAAMYAANSSKAGGITRFQAGCVMWEFIKQWQYIDGAATLLQYDDMLYPQYADRFTTIRKETWEDLQKKAKKKLEGINNAHPDIVKHWKSIVDGVIPFGYRLEEKSC